MALPVPEATPSLHAGSTLQLESRRGHPGPGPSTRPDELVSEKSGPGSTLPVSEKSGSASVRAEYQRMLSDTDTSLYEVEQDRYSVLR